MAVIAKNEKSAALEADAYHFRIDSLNSLLALVALLMAAFFPTWGYMFDHLGSIGIALFMTAIGLYSARNNAHQLIDRIPDASYFDLVRSAAKKVAGVHGTEKIGIQVYGPDAHVDIDIEVDPHMHVDQAHKISQQVRSSIQRDWPHVREVIVHVEPYYENDHT